MSVSIQRESIEISLEYDRLVGEAPGGAVATFTGYVREQTDDNLVASLEIEHYPEMAIRILEDLGRSAADFFNLDKWRIAHRFGELSVAENIVWVGTVASHRGNALSACEFIMDSLKTDAPFWKREKGPAMHRWVMPRGTDQLRRKRWDTQENM